MSTCDDLSEGISPSHYKMKGQGWKDSQAGHRRVTASASSTFPVFKRPPTAAGLCIQCYHQPRIFPAIHPPMKTHATSAPVRQSDLF